MNVFLNIFFFATKKKGGVMQSVSTGRRGRAAMSATCRSFMFFEYLFCLDPKKKGSLKQYPREEGDVTLHVGDVAHAVTAVHSGVHTHTHTHARTCTHTHTHTHTYTYPILSLPSLAGSDGTRLRHTHSYTYTHTRTHTVTHSHTHTRIY